MFSTAAVASLILCLSFVLRRSCDCFLYVGGLMRFGRCCRSFVLPARTVQKTENSRDKKERRQRGTEKSSNDASAERSVLLASLPQTKRHRDHADDHGECGH